MRVITFKVPMFFYRDQRFSYRACCVLPLNHPSHISMTYLNMIIPITHPNHIYFSYFHRESGHRARRVSGCPETSGHHQPQTTVIVVLTQRQEGTNSTETHSYPNPHPQPQPQLQPQPFLQASDKYHHHTNPSVNNNVSPNTFPNHNHNHYFSPIYRKDQGHTIDKAWKT